MILLISALVLAVAVPSTSQAGRLGAKAKKATKTTAKATAKSKSTRPSATKATGLKLRTTKAAKGQPAKAKATATAKNTKAAKSTKAAKNTKAAKKAKKAAKNSAAKLTRLRRVLTGLGITAASAGALLALNFGDPGNPTSLVSVATTVAVSASSVYFMMKSIWARKAKKVATR